MSDIRNNNLRKTSLPRTGRTLDAMAASSVLGSGGNLDPSSVKPSSLWYPDKLREYFRLNEDGTITLLATDLIVEGHILSRKSITAYASDDSTPTWFDKLPVASYDLKGILRIDQESPLKIVDGLLTLDNSLVGGISDILPAIGTGNVITSLGLADGGRKIQPYMGMVAWHAGNDGSGSGLDADLLDGHHWSEIAGLNVATATKLLYARTINGTSFDGTANIVTNTWGATRPFSIASHDFTGEGAAVSVNGFSSYVLPLPTEIKVNRISSMIHLDVAGTVGLGDKSGSWARLTGNRLDGMTVGGVMSDLYLNYSSPAKNVRIDKDGNLIVSGNIKATGAIMAYATDGATREGPIAGYEDGTLGMIRAYSGQFTIDPATGLLKIKDGVIGGFGDIAFSGDGPFLSDVIASADKRTLTFTRVGKPTYTALEVGAVSKNGDTMNGSLVINGSLYSNTGNYVSRIVGITGGWERGLMWDDLGATKTYGSVTMAGDASTPGYISIGFGAYNDAKRAFFYPNGNLTAYSFNAGSALIGSVAIQGGNEINNEYSDLYINYRGNRNIVTNGGGGSLDARGMIYAKKGVTSYSNNPSMSWGGWQDYNQPFRAADVTVDQGAYYPVIGWSSVMPNGYRQWSSIGSLRAGGFGDVVITVGSADNNSTSAKYFFSYDGTFTSSKMACNSTLKVSGLITGSDGIVLDGLSANSASHIRLVNSATGAQWGIKSGNYMNNENDFTITSESDSSYPSLVLQRNLSSYGKMKLISLNTSECSIGYVNNNSTLENPVWVVGANTGNATGIFGWYAGAVGTNIMSLTGSDGLYLHRGWLRTSEDTGWYSQKWGGGIYMDDNWVKAYNRPFMCPSSIGYGCNGFNVNLVIGHEANQSSAAEWACSDNIFGIGLHVDDHVYFWQGTSANRYSPAGKSYCGDINLVNNLFSWHGPVRSLSAITAYSTNGSDMRRKTVINPRYDLDPRSLLKVWTFTYRWNQDKDDTPLVGMSAQQMLHIAPDFVMGATDERGDYYTFDYGRFGAIGLVKTVRYVLPWMDRMDKWKDRKDREIETLRKAVRSQGRRITELEDIIQTLKAA